jgi:hypothetical protein
MAPSEKVVYPVGIACAFAYGLVWPLLLPKDVCPKISALLGNNDLVIAAVAVACAVLSATVGYYLGCQAHRQPMAGRLVITCYILMMPAAAVGQIVSMLLVTVGVCETKQALGFLAESAATGLCGGIAGMVAMRPFSAPKGPNAIAQGKRSAALGDRGNAP